MMKAKPHGFVKFDPQTRQLICQGEWDLDNVNIIQQELKKISLPSSGDVLVDGASITKMDSSGACILSDWMNQISKKGLKIHLQNFSEKHNKLLALIEKQIAHRKPLPPIHYLGPIPKLGKMTMGIIDEVMEYLSFIGKLTMEFLRIIARPTHIRWRAIVNIIDLSGFDALPIIALLSFMIGIVIAYQMALQLRNYGANIFIVDLLGLSVLREFGPLITAIMVAGRTGSAFTAQLGIMKINQEIDALDTMGVTPAEVLLLPRILGLLIALPLLTMWANIFGVLGGMVMANNMLDISWHNFLIRFQEQIPLRALIIGLGKAPVFALIISSIGCFEGMQVGGSADSVGKKTTQSVVLSIFFIIIVDAIFSIIFSKFKL